MNIKTGDYVEKWTLSKLESCGFVIQILGEKVFYEDSNRDVFCTLFKDLIRPSAVDQMITNPTSVEDCEGSD
jgi:hypothetical protein